MARSSWLLLAAIAAMLAIMAAKDRLVTLPAPPTAAAAGFDANRAIGRLGLLKNRTRM